MRQVVVVAALVIGCIALPAFGWGPDGHRIVCRIAFDNLSQPQQDEVNRLSRLYKKHGADFTSFPHACLFADDVRGSADFRQFDNTHFLNLPRDQKEVRESDCPDTCVLKGIAEHSEKLRTASNDLDRAEALFFLGHLYGDIHQPLHISFEDDRGGNSINRIAGGFYASQRNNLHRVWDSGILTKMMGESWKVFADALADSITDEQKAEWRTATPLEIAQGSYDISTSRSVLYCRMDQGVCKSLGAKRTLRASYQNEHDDIVKERLQRAGVRLAEAIKANLQ
jgi:hypothetical protein